MLLFFVLYSTILKIEKKTEKQRETKVYINWKFYNENKIKWPNLIDLALKIANNGNLKHYNNFLGLLKFPWKYWFDIEQII